MAETHAERYRRTRPVDYASTMEWAEFVRSIDPEAVTSATELGVVVEFSDGSIHRLDRKRKK